MHAFKDNEIVTEALKSVVNRRSNLRRRLLIIMAGVLTAIMAVFGVLKFLPNDQASASCTVIAEETATVMVFDKTASPQNAEQLKLSTAKAAPKTEVIVMPPVILGERSGYGPAIGSASKLTPIVKPETTMATTRIFEKTYIALRTGQAAAALEHLKGALSGAKEDVELKEAAVLEARALLLLGKIDEAKKKLESLGVFNSDTEIATDALLINFWCRTGSLSRLGDTDLAMLRAGAESWGRATAALEEARRAEDKTNDAIDALERVRALYQQALDADKLDDQAEKLCLERLVELTNRLVLDPKVACSAPKAVMHKVEPGEVLERIVRKYKVNQGQGKRINRLNDKLTVRYGQTLKLLPGDVLYKVNRSRLTGTLYIDSVFIRRYPVGIGPGNATPRGSYIVEKKVMNPDWYYNGKRLPFGDPANILGTRWMGFAASDNGGQGGGLGVHGTSLPESVPGRESKGCIRMLNKDVEELYDLMPQGGKVEIL
ncbi:MAG: L,D-transpeptidase family protein [Planctomycetota bacterium]